MKITEKDFNIQTGKETITERDETAQEIAEREAQEAKLATRQAEAEVKAAARQAVLARLGLTEEEAQLIIGGSN
jgi:hypothetical protein